MTKITIPSDTNKSLVVLNRLMAEIEAFGTYKEKQVFGIRLALEEAIMNAIKHGNDYDQAKQVQIEYETARTHTTITIQDQGKGFDPDKVPDPTTPENLEKDSGRGVMLMKHYAETITFSDDGRRVSMCFGTEPKDGSEQDKPKKSNDGKFETKYSGDSNRTSNNSITNRYRYAA